MNDLERMVNAIGCAAHAAYSLGLATPRGWENFQDPKVGDLVLELSTFYYFFGSKPRVLPGRSLLDCVGILEEKTDEPIDMEWDEAEEGRPLPKETIFYVRTFDGRRFRWSNANFIRVPTETKLEVASHEPA